MVEERVRVTVERSGGMTGRRMPPAVLDTAELPAHESRRVRDLVAEATADDLPTVSTTPRGRDMVRYDMTMMRNGETWRLVFDDGGVPARVRPLLDLVLERGRTA